MKSTSQLKRHQTLFIAWVNTVTTYLALQSFYAQFAENFGPSNPPFRSTGSFPQNDHPFFFQSTTTFRPARAKVMDARDSG